MAVGLSWSGTDNIQKVFIGAGTALAANQISEIKRKGNLQELATQTEIATRAEAATIFLNPEYNLEV